MVRAELTAAGGQVDQLFAGRELERVERRREEAHSRGDLVVEAIFRRWPGTV